MKYILLIVAAGFNNLGFGAAENEIQKIKLYPKTLKSFERSVLFYDRIANNKGIPQDKGLAKIYRDMQVEGIGKVVQDQRTLQEAERLKEPLRKNKGILSLLSSCTEGICLVQDPFVGISVLAQKDLLLAMNQEGFNIKLPKGDLDKLFAKKPDEDLVKQFLELNTEFPTTPEATAIFRACLIAKHYIIQRCLKALAESMP